MQRKQAGLARRMMQFQLRDSQPMLFHNEPVWRDGTIAGRVTSAAYGHHLGAAIGLGYVACTLEEKPADMLASSYQIEVAGERCDAIASLRPLYDPQGERIRL